MSVPPDTATRRPARNDGLAFGWGFAEATFFFIVPDVLTTRLAMHGLRPAMRACAIAWLGAMLGGALIFGLARDAAVAVGLRSAFEVLPGISPTLIDRAQSSLQADGLTALFAGALGGVPYKLFAWAAAQNGSGWLPFLLFSAAARFGRFAITTLGAGIIARLLHRKFPPDRILLLHVAAWIAFYGWYFWAMRGN